MGLHVGDLVNIKDELLEGCKSDPILTDWVTITSIEIVQALENQTAWIRYYFRDSIGRLGKASAYPKDEGFHAVRYISEGGL